MNKDSIIILSSFGFILGSDFIRKILKLVLFLLLLNIIYSNYLKRKKICLCSIGKNENLYIEEFINYYKKLGYNKIFLYDNNDINEERFEDTSKTNNIILLFGYLNFMNL